MITKNKTKVIQHSHSLLLALAVLALLFIPGRIFTADTVSDLSYTPSLSDRDDAEARFDIEFPELAPIRLPEVTEYKLKNGISFLLSENHDFPTISLAVLVKGGSYFEEPDQIGKVEILSDLLRTGGTANYSSDELNRLLDDMAISMTASGRIHSIRINMSFLAEDIDTALSILNDVLRNPTFNEESLQRAKMSMNTQIARRNDDISSITGREFMKLLFGEDNPYARTYKYETIANIDQADLITYHETFFRPQNISISIVGDFKVKEMQKKLNNTLGNWKKESFTFPEPEIFQVNHQSSVNLIQREDAQQSWIAIGHLTEMTQRHPDYVPMLVLNSVLGGGFSGRIYQRIRNQLGLAYAPQAYYSVYYDFPGVFYLMSQTVADRTIAAIEALIDEITILQEEYITEDELRLAKESFLNSFVFNYDSPEAIVNRQLNYKFWDYPIDFLEQVRDKVNQVTVADIHRLSNDYLYPEHFVVLAVGNDKEFEKPLSELNLGEVNIIDISIPRPQQDITKPSPQRVQLGEALFDEYLKKMGDVSDISNIKLSGVSTEYREEGSSTVETTAYIAYPDKITQMIKTPRGPLTMTYNQGATKLVFPGGEMALPPELADELRNHINSNPVNLAKNYREMFDVYFVEEKRLADKDFYILSFNDEYNQFLLFLDKETMLPYQTVQETIRPDKGLMTIYRIYEEYETVDGIIYPVKIVTKDETGIILSEDVFNEVKFNIELPEEIFTISKE
jgi:predicted Zn-dependent peptidase